MDGVHTLVVAGKIKRGRESDYERWVGKVVTALHDAPGYDGMTAISSPDPQGRVGTLLIRFRSTEALSEWDDSPVRHSLIEEDQFSATYYHAGAGQEVFFSIPRMSAAPSRWKMCLLTIPTVYLLFNITLFAFERLVPSAKEWSPLTRMAPVIPIVVVLLTYVCLPPLSRIFASWLFSDATPLRRRTVVPTSPEDEVQASRNRENSLHSPRK
jgi:uncharacterized protein